MLIIWRGWGFVVVPIFIVALVAAVGLVKAVGATTPLVISSVWAICGVIAGFGVWLFAARFEQQPGRVFIDKATGREITVRRTAGSLFFIPTKYWAFIGAALCILVGLQAPYEHNSARAQNTAPSTHSP